MGLEMQGVSLTGGPRRGRVETAGLSRGCWHIQKRKRVARGGVEQKWVSEQRGRADSEPQAWGGDEIRTKAFQNPGQGFWCSAAAMVRCAVSGKAGVWVECLRGLPLRCGKAHVGRLLSLKMTVSHAFALARGHDF